MKKYIILSVLIILIASLTYAQETKSIETNSIRFSDGTIVLAKDMDIYWKYSCKYSSLQPKQIAIYIEIEKSLNEMKQLQKQAMNKIKWQRRINWGKSILKWTAIICAIKYI